MGFWEGFALGIMTGGVFGIVFAGIMSVVVQAKKCEACQADIIKSLQGKIKGG